MYALQVFSVYNNIMMLWRHLLFSFIALKSINILQNWPSIQLSKKMVNEKWEKLVPKRFATKPTNHKTLSQSQTHSRMFYQNLPYLGSI